VPRIQDEYFKAERKRVYLSKEMAAKIIEAAGVMSRHIPPQTLQQITMIGELKAAITTVLVEGYGYNRTKARDTVNAKFEEYRAAARTTPIAQGVFVTRMLELYLEELCEGRREENGKVLGCWCAPRHCHGDVLIELIEKRKAER